MNRFMAKTRGVVAFGWRHTSAGVAVLLIVLALVVGYRLGKPGDRVEAQVGVDEPHGDGAHAHQGAAADEGRVRYYTCSMHPSVRLTDPDAKCPICFMDLIPVEDGSGAGDGDAAVLTMRPSEVAISRIQTTPVARFFPEAETRLYGKVTYDETSVARLTAYFPARIDRLFVNYVGVPVAEGDHIAEVYSPDLIAAFEELKQAARAVEEAGGMSELVFSSTRDTLVAAREKLGLYGLGAEQIEEVESGAFDADRLTVYAPIGGVVTHLAVREGDYVKEGSPIATVADLSRLWLDLEAYESQLPMLRWGQRVSFTVEAHPGEVFEGRISFIEPMVDERTRTASVRVEVNNAERRLKPGMFASAVVDVRLTTDGAVAGDELAGKWVSPMHPTVVKDGPGACDICGMDLVPAETLGMVGDPDDAVMPLVIPRSAVLFTGKRSVVYVAVGDEQEPAYEGRAVVLGPRAGSFYTVREGLEEGDEVVTNGAFRIDSAMQIMAKPSMMTPRGHADTGERVKVPSSFVDELKPVYAAYLDMQAALAADDLPGFRVAAGDLRNGVRLVGVEELSGASLDAWRRASGRLVTNGVEAEGGAGGVADLDGARAWFDGVSGAVIGLLDLYGHRGGETWRVAYCPMAFDGAGAEWVQRGVEISNPYFGESMLRCGEIRRELVPLNAGAGASGGASHGGHSHD